MPLQLCKLMNTTGALQPLAKVHISVILEKMQRVSLKYTGNETNNT